MVDSSCYEKFFLIPGILSQKLCLSVEGGEVSEVISE